MLRKMLGYFALPLLLLLSNSSGNSAPQLAGEKRGRSDRHSGKDDRRAGKRGDGSRFAPAQWDRFGTKEAKPETLRFQVGPNSFFTALVFNDAFRGPEAGSMGLIAENTATLPGPLQTALNQLVIEKLPSDAPFDLAVRDGKTGFVFFNIEGNLYEYDAAAHLLSDQGRKAADFRRVCEQAGASCGRGCARWEDFNLDDDVSDRNHHTRQRRGPIVGPARLEAGLRMFRILCRDLMSSWEICPPCSNLAVAEPRSAWRWERPPAITE